MRKGIVWIWVGVTLAAAPVVAAGSADRLEKGQERTAKAAEERMVDLEELRASFFERLGEILAGGWFEARGTIEPADGDSVMVAPELSASCSDGARGTIEPQGCGS